MSFRLFFLRKYLPSSQVLFIISHHWRRYLKLVVGYLFLLIILFFLWYKLSYFIDNIYFDYFFGILGLFLYLKFVIDFLDIYLDSIVLLDTGIVLFYWEGLLRYKSEFIQWNTVDSVYDEQNGLFDIIFGKGNIKIKRYEQEYIFEDVPNPSYNAGKIIEFKNKLYRPEYEKEQFDDLDMEDDEVKYMAEAIAEVIYKYKLKDKE